MVDELSALTEVDQALRDDVLARLSALTKNPLQAAAFANGLILDGTARRLKIQSGLQQFMKLPPAEARLRVRARMADLIASRVSAAGCVTREDLIAGGFTLQEIDEHFTEAKRAARVAGMAV